MTVTTGDEALSRAQFRQAQEQRRIATDAVAQLPAWPLLALLWGLPLWWVLGLFPVSSVIVAVPMVCYLVLKRDVVVVPGILPYVALLAWMVPSALMLDGGMLSFLIRFSQLASVAVIAVYVVNARAQLPDSRILAGLVAVWGAVVAGGYLGLLAPDLQLTWTVGRLLPGGLAGNDYVRDMVFPTAAEIQHPWGAPEPFVRPSAPFSYTNGWGASIALFVPVLLGAGLRTPTPVRKGLVLAAIALTIPPALATTNRGLFLTWAVVLAYVALRLTLRGHLAVPLAAGVGVGILSVSGGWAALMRLLTARQEVVDTTAGRAGLYREAFERTLGSPLLGFGAPRQSYWSEIYVGTQGMVWNVLFCFGFVGLGLFAWFMLGLVLRTFAAPTTWQLWLHSALVAAAFMSIFYGLDRHLPYIAVVAAMLLRHRYLPPVAVLRP
ncbi:hypothetical protein [Ornithinimicrobium panacihumi]|uniref:hypothetical protein n=1 Tax=Ornithinimicrobium panacihumi TaxID=2008449 RepID=UPI003F8A7145